MFRLRDLCKEHLDMRRIHFSRRAALPAVTRQEFTGRLGIQPPGEMLFAGDCADSGVLREQVTRLVNQAAVAMPADRIGREARDTIISALLRAEHYNYFLDCACGHSVLLHTNIPLECWE